MRLLTVTKTASKSLTGTALKSSVKAYDVLLEREPYYDQSCAKVKFLNECLKQIPEHGFTQLAIKQASNIMGYTPVTHTIVDRGPIELVEYFIRSSTENLKLSIKNNDEFKSLKTTAKISLLCRNRLMMTAPYIHKWPGYNKPLIPLEAVKLMANPLNFANSVENLADLCDEIWFLAGDSSTDFNWYTKRMILSAVYTSTEMFMTQDQSDGFKDTFEFLNRRLRGN